MWSEFFSRFFVLNLTRWIALIWVCSSGLLYAQSDVRPSGKPLVMLISIDGFKPAYMNSVDTPNLLKLKRDGAHAQGLISSFPSLTFPNHLSLVSGQTPDHHGIVNNTMLDPELPGPFHLGAREVLNDPRWWSEARPIWLDLRAQGKKSSTLFWPGSEVPIQGIWPDDWLPYQHQMSHEQRIKTLIQWLSRSNETRADFATLYFSDVDSAGHQFGPDAPEVKAASQAVDRSIGDLVEALKTIDLWRLTTLIVVSDHGMAKVDHKIDVGKILKEGSQVRWEWLGAVAGLRLNGEDSKQVLDELSLLAHLNCWLKAELPARFRFGQHRRIPDIVCLAEPGHVIVHNLDRSVPLGQHGYDPQLEDMWGLLIASGYRIQPATSGLINNLDVYALLCRLLNIEPHTHDGDPSTLKAWLKN